MPVSEFLASFQNNLYAVLDDRSQWPVAIRALCESSGTTHAILSTSRTTAQYGFVNSLVEFRNWGLTDEDLAVYAKHHHPLAPWPAHNAAIQPGNIFDTAHLSPDELLESHRSYSEFLRPRNLHYGACGVLLDDEGIAISLTLLRPKHAGRLKDSELARIREVIPHLQRVCRLDRRITDSQSEREALHNLLDSLNTGAILLNEDGRILIANHYARQLLSNDAPIHVDGDGILYLTPEACNLKLLRILDRFRKTAPDLQPAAEFVPAGDRFQCRLHIHPCLSAEGGRRKAMVHIFDRRPAALIERHVVRELFSLSPTEEKVALKLAAGLSLAEVGASLHISLHTVRSHLRNLFRKTGTTHQAALVSAVLRAAERSA